MTPRRRRPLESAPARRVARDQFPALSEFLAGYLQEDFRQEHGSPAAAARAFAADADAPERQALAVDLHRFLALTEGWPLDDLRQALTTLGAAWHPASRAEVEALVTERLDQ